MWATPPANTVVTPLPRFSKGREEVGPGSQTSHSLRHECTNRIVDTAKPPVYSWNEDSQGAGQRPSEEKSENAELAIQGGVNNVNLTQPTSLQSAIRLGMGSSSP